MKTQQIVRMYNALKTIAKDYQTPEQLRKKSEKQYGLDYEEALEMSYENIQTLAKSVIKGINISALHKTIKTKP